MSVKFATSPRGYREAKREALRERYRWLDAQRIEARRAETRRGSVEDESRVGAEGGDAPKPSPEPVA